jgi:hypothetical protein
MSTKDKTTEAPPPEIKTHDLGADLIFFDNAPTFATYNGVVAITLSAARYLPDGKAVALDQVVTAHLRTNIQGALQLRKVIDDVLLLAAPPEGQKN